MLYFYLFLVALAVVARWAIFSKANVPGWASLIPFYGTFKFFEITVGNGWNMLYCLIPVIGQIYYIYVSCVKLSQVFGHKAGYTLGLFFLPLIFMLIIGFGSSEYLGVTDAESIESLAALYLIGGIALILSIPALSNTFRIGIGLLAASVGVTGVVFIIIGLSGISAVLYDAKRMKALESQV